MNDLNIASGQDMWNEFRKIIGQLNSMELDINLCYIKQQFVSISKISK